MHPSVPSPHAVQRWEAYQWALAYGDACRATLEISFPQVKWLTSQIWVVGNSYSTLVVVFCSWCYSSTPCTMPVIPLNNGIMVSIHKVIRCEWNLYSDTLVASPDNLFVCSNMTVYVYTYKVVPQIIMKVFNTCRKPITFLKYGSLSTDCLTIINDTNCDITSCQSLEPCFLHVQVISSVPTSILLSV